MLSDSVRLADCSITFNVFFYRTSRCWAVLCYSPWTSCKWWIVNWAFIATFSYACPRNVNIGCEPACCCGCGIIVFETLPPWPSTALSTVFPFFIYFLVHTQELQVAFPPVEMTTKVVPFYVLIILFWLGLTQTLMQQNTSVVWSSFCSVVYTSR